MFSQPKAERYFDGFNGALFDTVPPTARRILEIGCSRGNLGAALKEAEPERYVIGVDIDGPAASVARERLDEVHVLDIQSALPPVEAGTVDAILFGDVLEHLVDPEDVLRRVKPMLSPQGVVLASIPNMGHWSVLYALARSDLMYQPDGLLDATHLRFFTLATIFKMFLDAGYLPDRDRVMTRPMDETLMQAISPLLKHVRMEPDRGRSLLEAHQYVISARPLPDIDKPFSSVPMTFVACVNDDEQLDSNLLRSPCLGPGTPHQVILQRGQSSAAQGFNDGLSRAEHDLVVFVHQDMYLPRGWDTRFTRAWSEAAEKYSPLGAAGLYGLTYRDEGRPTPIGRVVSQERALDRPTPMPAPADGFDEILLAVPRDTPYRFDERLGFHSYGADLCLSLRELGQFAVVLEAPAFHNSLRAGLDSAFHISREILLAKWPETRPLFGPTGRLDIMTADYDRSQRIAELTTRMEALRRERDSMLASNSWRLTAPLRRIRDLVRPRRRPGRP